MNRTIARKPVNLLSKQSRPSTRRSIQLASIILSFAIFVPSSALYAERLILAPIEVTATSQNNTTTRVLGTDLPSSTDTAALLKGLPGADINQNGPLTGIAQYRGYFGDRVNVTVGDMHLKPAGPNSMDPPLSHIPPTLIESIQLIRGIAPVSSGLETIGGTINASPKTSQFGRDDSFQQTGKLALGFNEVSSGTQTSLFTSLANSNHRFHLSGSVEQGDDYNSPGGTITPSEYERATLGFGYGMQTESGQSVEFDYHYNDTGLTGTPALPMDIVSASGDIYRLNYSTNINDLGLLELRLNYEDLEHVMDNVSLRNPPNMTNGMPMNRIATTDVDGFGFSATLTTSTQNGTAKYGIDGDTANHNALITDPTNAMFMVDNFNDVERNRTGAFVEWRENPSEYWSLSAGARVTQVDSDAGTVSHSMAMMNPNIMTLVSRFNNADRKQSDTNLDLVLSALKPLTNHLTLELSAARKNRSPSYQERYLWIPLQSTGGLADGNNYSGNISLNSETSNQLEIALNWKHRGSYLNPRIYFHKITDYIQGVPETDSAAIMVSAMMTTTAPLKFDNVDARMYGFDTDWGVQLNASWQLDGIISYTRGKRDDINDHLYRIAPLNGLIALTYTAATYTAVIETQAYTAQNKVSSTNNEQTTAGYALINLRAVYNPSQHVSLGTGIENLLDKQYQQHLGGVNRASSNSIPVGTRLTGPGTNFYLTANLSW